MNIIKRYRAFLALILLFVSFCIISGCRSNDQRVIDTIGVDPKTGKVVNPKRLEEAKMFFKQ